MRYVDSMIAELSEALEHGFSFDSLQGLENTKERLNNGSGRISYIPTNYPIPKSKRALKVVVGDTNSIRALPMPSDKEELQETIFAAVEFIVEKECTGNVVFFCPAPLTSEIESCRGTDFFQLKRVEIEDPNHVRRQVYEDLTGDSIQQLPTQLPEFLLQAYLAHTLNSTPNLSTFKTTDLGDSWDMYIPYSAFLNESDQFCEFYLEVLGIRSIARFRDLPEQRQNHSYNFAIYRRYGSEYSLEISQFVTRWREIDGKIKTLFRSLAQERLAKGRLFNKELLDLTEQEGREFIEEVQRAYQNLFDSNDSINQRNPEEAADNLIQYFGLLYQDATKEEFEPLLLTVRDKLTLEADRIEDRPSTGQKEAFDQLNKILECVSQLQLIVESSIIEQEFHSDKWIDSLEILYEEAQTSGFEDRFEYMSIPALEEAHRRVERRKEAESEAEKIRQIDVELDSAPSFLEQWADFITEHLGDKLNSEAYHQAMVEKYDEFSDTLVQTYPSLINDPNTNHISGLIDEDTDELQIVVVIDSLGFLDFALMEEWDIFTPPVDVEPLYSNIPSYTPSAMSTILTGLPAEQTGIYNWKVRKEDRILNMKGKVSTDKFDFIDRTSPLSYQLVQNHEFNDSGITRFATELGDIKLTEGFQREDQLEDLTEEVEEELETLLENRKELLAGTADVPEEYVDNRIDALHDTYVVYIEDFDSLLHKDLSKYEFKNYYTSLGGFLNDLITKLKNLIKEYSYDESPKLVLGGDHGKITRQEQELVLDVRNQERFTQDALSQRSDLELVHSLNLDEARFSDKEGSIFLGLGDFDDPSLIARAREQEAKACESAPDSEILGVIESKPFVVSGSKYLFGWQPTSASIDMLQFGYDTYQPAGNGIFDTPTIGLLSRYKSKNTPKAHGYHGGTSISEMAAAKLTFNDEDI